MSAAQLRIGVACFSTFGGSGVIASEIGMAMARRGHRVAFLSDKPPARLDLSCPNISFHAVATLDYPVPAQSSYALALAAEMIEVAQKERLDLLHVHYAVPHALGAYLARQVLGAAAPKVIVTLHGTDITRIGADPKFSSLVRFAVLACDGITAPSGWLAEEAYRQLGLPRETSIEVIPNFVDTHRFCPWLAARSHPAERESSPMFPIFGRSSGSKMWCGSSRAYAAKCRQGCTWSAMARNVRASRGWLIRSVWQTM